MSSRDRWTVYPLLFLTLGIALKDKLTRTLETDLVVCKTIWVTDQQQHPEVKINSTAGGGLVTTFARDGALVVAVGHESHAAGFLVADHTGRLIPPSLVVRRGTAHPSEPTPLEQRPAAEAAPETHESVPSDQPHPPSSDAEGAHSSEAKP